MELPEPTTQLNKPLNQPVVVKLLALKSREIMLNEYSELRAKLGNSGASKKTASLIIAYLTNPTDTN